MSKKSWIIGRLIDENQTSSYFNEEKHGPARGYVEEPAVQFVRKEIEKERKRKNGRHEDEKELRPS